MSNNKEKIKTQSDEEDELVEREIKDDESEEEQDEEEEKPKRKKPASKEVEEEDDGKAEEAEDDEELMFDPSKKKKKKKKIEAEAEGEPEGETEEALMFDPSKKKKKKPVAESAIEEETVASTSAAPNGATANGDGYSYQELLKRVYDLIREKNPERLKEEGLPLPPAQVFQVGTKRTSWANFSDFCKLVKRAADHVLAYTLSELATEGSLDGKGRLTVKGRFKPRQLEKVMRHYAGEYVVCRSCKSSDTFLKKENRLFFLVCNSCGCSKSVANIQKGLPMIKKRSQNK